MTDKVITRGCNDCENSYYSGDDGNMNDICCDCHFDSIEFGDMIKCPSFKPTAQFQQLLTQSSQIAILEKCCEKYKKALEKVENETEEKNICKIAQRALKVGNNE